LFSVSIRINVIIRDLDSMHKVISANLVLFSAQQNTKFDTMDPDILYGRLNF